MFSWSATKIETAQECLKRYWYAYVKKEKVPITGSMAMGIFLHRKAEHFWKKENGGIFVPKYKSSETFVNAASGWWKRSVIRNSEIGGKLIKWKDKNEPWQLNEDIKKICLVFYDKSIQDKAPIFSEKNFKFILDNRQFNGYIDEIRDNYTLRDYKSGKRVPGRMRLDYDIKFTLYTLAFCNLCYSDEKFAEKCGVDSEDRTRWGGNPIWLDDKVTFEYHFMRTGEIYTTKRNDSHFEDFNMILDSLEERIKINDFSPNRTNCDYCLYNEICDRDTQNLIIDEKPEQLILIDIPGVERSESKNLKLKFPRKKEK